MNRIIPFLALAALVACAKTKELPENAICGPKSAFSFPPQKGEAIRTYGYWRARLSLPEGVTAGMTEAGPDGRSLKFRADDLCVIAPETKVEVAAANKEYLLIAVHPPLDLDAFEPVTGGRLCPEGPSLIISVMQYALMARDAHEAEDEAASKAARSERFKHGETLNPPQH